MCCFASAICLVSLTRSCLKAFDCTYQADRDISTLDAMPDVICDGTLAFVVQEMAAILLVMLYCAVVPAGLWLRLFILKDKGRLHDSEVQQSYGWCDPSFDQSLLDVSPSTLAGFC